MRQPLIYFITAYANCKDKYLEKLNEEQSRLKKHFQDTAITCQQIEVEKATLNDLQNAFMTAQKNVGVFHYAGHANGPTLQLEDTRVNSTGLAMLMKEQICVPLIFLNGCSTQKQVKFFKEAGAGAIICTTAKINDPDAVAFADRFYESFLLKKRSIQESFEDAKIALVSDERSGKSLSSFRDIVRENRQIIIPREEENASGESAPWTLEVFDNAVLTLKADELSAFIQRRKLVVPYTAWLVKQHFLMHISGLIGTTQIELDKVFVTLHGELSKSYEVMQAHKLLEEEVGNLERLLADQQISAQELRQKKYRLLGRSVFMSALEERAHRQRNKFAKGYGKMDMCEAFKGYDKLVILGDPGTGKTTLARWLVLRFAMAMKDGQQDVFVASDKFGAPQQQLTDAPLESFGFARLPILLRISEYAQFAEKTANAQIEDFLGQQSWLGNLPTFGVEFKEYLNGPIPQEELRLLMLDFIAKGEALIILDGLDEIIDEDKRKLIARQVERFIAEVVELPRMLGIPQRNKLIVTSRIAGYHFNPIFHEDLFHVTIQPMDGGAIRNFCTTWMLAAFNQRDGATRKAFQVDYEARQAAREMVSLIFEPSRQGVKDLSGNPLLLTELCKMFISEDRKLPETRIELYERTAHNMLEIWRNRVMGRFDETEINVFEEKMFFVLEDIASYIHEMHNTGLISEPELNEVVKSALKNFYQRNAQVTTTQTIQSEVRVLIRLIDEEVGILAARANKFYGFLHLTFEEFFAAKKLLRDPEQISRQILDKAYQPRWRESLILAISYLGKVLPLEKDRKKALRDLLNTTDPMGNLVPRSASLIAMAIPEMNYSLEKELIAEVIGKLLDAYEQAGAFDEGEVLRQSVVDTFTTLRKNPAVWTDVLSSIRMILARVSTSPEQKNAVAHLVFGLGMYDKRIAEALVAIQGQDLQHWDWPIYRALKFIADNYPSWIGFAGLPMRKFLFDFPDMLAKIHADRDWLTVVALLFGGLSIPNENNGLVEVIDGEKIFFDSGLTDLLIDLLEKDQPVRTALPACHDIWQNNQQPLSKRIDCLLLILALEGNLKQRYYEIEQLRDLELLEALRQRVERLMKLYREDISSAIKKSYKTLEGLIQFCEEEEVYRLILTFYNLDSVYNKQTDNLVNLLQAVPDAIKPLILAEIWVKTFYSDDGPYNLSVILDTLGQTIEQLGLDVISKSLASVPQVSVLPPFERWHIERSPYIPQTEVEILEKALFNLSAIHPDYDFFKYWGLAQLKPIWIKYPALNNVCELVVLSIKSKKLLHMAYSLLFEADINDQAVEEMEGKLQETESGAVLFYAQMLNLGNGLKQPRILISKVNEVKEPAHHLDLLFVALSTLRTLGAMNPETQMGGSILQLYTEDILKVIGQLKTLDQKTTALLKLTLYQVDAGKRNELIRAALDVANKIEDKFTLAKVLKEIRPWAAVEPSLDSEWQRLTGRLDDERQKALLENRLYPTFINLPGERHDPVSAITSIGAFLHDLNQLASLPDKIETLWEMVRYSSSVALEAIVRKIYEMGLKNRYRLTIPGAMGMAFLLEKQRADLFKQLMICVDNPTSEAIPIITKWLNQPDEEIAVFASLLLLETGILNVNSFSFLQKGLFGRVFPFQDQFRNRMNLSLNGSQHFYTSRMTTEGVLASYQAIIDNWDTKPYLTRGLAWLPEMMVYDDAEIISNLIELSKGSSRKSLCAKRALKGIHKVHPRAFEAYLEGFLDEDDSVQKRLLFSAIFVLHQYNSFTIKKQHLVRMRAVLKQLAESGDKDARSFAVDAMGYLPQLTPQERDALRQIVLADDPDLAPLALVSLGRADKAENLTYIHQQCENSSTLVCRAAHEALARILIQEGGATEEVLMQVLSLVQRDPKRCLQALLDASKHRWWDNYARNCSALIGLFFSKYPEEYAAFVLQANTFLESQETPSQEFNYAESIRWMTRSFQIEALAAGAQVLPDTFQLNAKAVYEMEDKLCHIVLKDGVFTNRISAIIALSLLKKMSENCTKAFSAAMKDVSEVQTAAISCLFRFYDISDGFVRQLSADMDNESYSARFGIINILAAIGNNNKTDSALRQEISELLIDKLGNPEYRWPVYLYRNHKTRVTHPDGTISENDEGRKIEFRGSLNQEIYRRILEVSGVRNQEII